MSKRDFFEDDKTNKMIGIFCIVLVISVIVFLIIFSMYNKKLKEEANLSVLEIGAVNTIVPNDENTLVTSSSQDKTVNDISNNSVNNTNNTTNNSVNVNITNKTDTSNNTNIASNTSSTVNITNTSKNNTSSAENVTKTNAETATQNNVEKETEENANNLKSVDELKFAAPVSGEILKDYASDSLIYSNTLEEWTTHLGVDIKAERTTVVSASEDGTIESIKNDPRYGLTVTINHGNGYKTIYSNLLTTEFVKVGDEVEKGQTIATVGDSASFEILDEPHLHFEMTIDGESVNPTAYFN